MQNSPNVRYEAEPRFAHSFAHCSISYTAKQKFGHHRLEDLKPQPHSCET